MCEKFWLKTKFWLKIQKFHKFLRNFDLKSRILTKKKQNFDKFLKNFDFKSKI